MITPPAAPAAEPLSATFKRSLAQLADVMHGRFELLKFELGDERERLGRLLSRSLLAALLCLLSVQMVVLLAMALVWDTQWRVPVAGAFAFIAVTATLLVVRSIRAVPASALFEATAAQMAKDGRAIDGAL